MTVVAYKSGIMASDSLATDPFSGDVFTAKCSKIFRLSNGALLGESGDYDSRDLQEMLSRATPKKLPSRREIAETRIHYAGLLVFPKGEIFEIFCHLTSYENSDDWEAAVIRIPDNFHAVGSGAPYALSAMRIGSSAIKAVEHAIEMNAFCGGRVQRAHLHDKRLKRK